MVLVPHRLRAKARLNSATIEERHNWCMEEGKGSGPRPPASDAATVEPVSWPSESFSTPITDVDTGTPGQLPTTSGIEAVGMVTIALIAALIIAAGWVMLRRSCRSGEW